jgi:serine/threonine-protein kinase
MSHPSDETLAQMAHGRLEGSDLEAVELHLDACPSCRSLVAAVTKGSTPYAQPERVALQTGEKLGRYEIDVLLAAGGMGMLYTARDTQLNRRTVLKLMRPRFAGELGRVRLLREAQAMASLSHPNVVHVYELGESEGRVFVAMELVEGGTLRDWMKSPGSWKDVVAMMVQAGKGLAAAHGAGVVHRDFKPENVLVGRDGRPRVGDFGLSRPELVAEEEPPPNVPMRVTQTGTMLGTPAYMSPEQLAGKPADARSDQYSFCVVLYEALAGKRPFVADTVEELRARVAGGMPPPPKDGPVPPMVWAVIARGLQPNPEKRFPSMDELLELLGEPIPRALMPRASRFAIAGQIAAGALAVLLIGVGAWAYWTLRTPPLLIPGDISVASGRKLFYDAPGVQRIEVTGKSLERSELLNGRVTLVAGEPGEATLWLHMDDGSARSAAVHVHEEPGTPHPMAAPDPAPGDAPDAFVNLPEEIDLVPEAKQTFDVGDIQNVETAGTAIEATEQHDDGSLSVIAGKGGKGSLRVTLTDGRVWHAEVEVTGSAPEGDLPEKVELELGASRSFRVEGIARVAVGDDSIANVRTGGDNVIEVTADGLGSTTLLIWTAERRIETTVTVSVPPAVEPGTDVVMKPGMQRVLSLPGIKNLTVTDPAIADGKVIGDSEILIIGGAPGSTTLLAWTQDGRHVSHTVTVSAPDPVPGAINLTLKKGDIVRFGLQDTDHCVVNDHKTLTIDCEHGQLEMTALRSGSSTVRVERRGQATLNYAVQVR